MACPALQSIPGPFSAFAKGSGGGKPYSLAGLHYLLAAPSLHYLYVCWRSWVTVLPFGGGVYS